MERKGLGPLSGGASLRVIENKELLCKTCLLGRQERSNTVICHLERDDKRVEANYFCGQGIWWLDGKAMDFKEAWAYINREERNGTSKS